MQMKMSNQQHYEDYSLVDTSPMFESLDSAPTSAMPSSTLYGRSSAGLVRQHARTLDSTGGQSKSPRIGLGTSPSASKYVLSESHAIHQLESLLMQDTRLPGQGGSEDDFGNPLGFMNLGSGYNGSDDPAIDMGRPGVVSGKHLDYYASHVSPPASTTANSPMMMAMMSASGEMSSYAASRPIPMSSVTGYHMHRSSSTSPLVSQSLVPGTPAMAYHTPTSQSYPAQPLDFGSPTLSVASSMKRRKESETQANCSPYMYSSQGSPSPSMSMAGSPSDSMLSHYSKRERNRLAAERCRKKKQELIGTLSGENQALKQENLELAKVNQVLEQKLDYLINVMANYGIPMPYKK